MTGYPKDLAAQLQFGKPGTYCTKCSWCFAFKASTEACNLSEKLGSHSHCGPVNVQCEKCNSFSRRE